MTVHESHASTNDFSLSHIANRVPPPAKKKERRLFPTKLYEMLEGAESLDLSAAVSWLPHGRAFIVKDKELFIAKVLLRFFKATKMRSFQRQLNLWCFHRIHTGPDAGAWWHESFVRGRPQDLTRIVRIQLKGNTSSEPVVPNYYEEVPTNCETDDARKCKSKGKQAPLPACRAGAEDFDHLDKEFESLFDSRFNNDSRRNASFIAEPEHLVIPFNCGSNNVPEKKMVWKEPSVSSYVSSNEHNILNPELETSLSDPQVFSNGSLISKSSQIAIGNKPANLPKSCVVDRLSDEEDIGALDEFSMLIEKTIHYP
ncbi:hypothetical protein ACHAXR_004409 [Thalassiosira sp. AJA248-18]